MGSVQSEYGHSMSASLPGHRPRVIVAEDDPEMRRLLTATIAADGYDVTNADTGPALLMAIGRFGQENALPALIVSDIRMPGRSGLQVLQWLRDAGWQVPVILITAFGGDEVMEQATHLGAACVLSKPFDLDDLRTTVARLAPCDAA